MHLKKLVVPIVGLCAISGFSSPATAQLWAKNCVTNQCLDATTADPNGPVQVSDCDTSKKAQQWHQNSPGTKRLQNAYEGFGKPCLDMNAETSVVTNKCQKWLNAQKWAFADNGQVGPIKNKYWGKCLVVGDNNTVTVETCNDKSRPQAWYWVNVGDESPCPGETEDSRTKLPPQVQPIPTMKQPSLGNSVSMADLKPICSVTPPGSCTRDLNECGNPSVCQCPVAYTYNPATGQCDYAFKKLQTSGAEKCKKPDCSIDPKSVCTLDRNECGNPSFCVCPKGYEYNPATKKCDIDL